MSWNNDQAPGFSAADDNWSFGSVQRAQLIDTFVRRGLRGGRKLTLNGLVQAMEEPATQDIRGVRVLPTLLRAIGRPRDRASRDALALLASWSRRGAHRRDLDGDGRYDDDAAVTLMDAWWPKAVSAVFARSLKGPAFGAITTMIDVGDHTDVAKPDAPSFYFGWWGYVHKDLRTLFGRRDPRGRFSRVHCGGGSKRACRRALQGLAARCAEGRPRPALRQGRLRQGRAGVVLRPQPLDRRLGDRRAPGAVPEPADVPADGRAHAEAAALSRAASRAATRPGSWTTWSWVRRRTIHPAATRAAVRS